MLATLAPQDPGASGALWIPSANQTVIANSAQWMEGRILQMALSATERSALRAMVGTKIS
jgi:hypothetical protein